MMRWNAGFVRGLAQGILERAKVIRGGLVSTSVGADAAGMTGTPSKRRRKKPAKKSRKVSGKGRRKSRRG